MRCNPKQAYSEVTPTAFNEVYTQESIFRITASDLLVFASVRGEWKVSVLIGLLFYAI